MRAFGIIFMLMGFIFYASELSYAQDQTTAQTEEQIELRAREIGHALRCVVCQNQSIEESDASLAEDMRKLVRARVREGETNAEVIDFMQQRYGDFVLLKPPVQGNTYILWIAPFLIVFLGAGWFALQSRRKQEDVIAPLSETELEELSSLTRSQPDVSKTGL